MQGTPVNHILISISIMYGLQMQLSLFVVPRAYQVTKSVDSPLILHGCSAICMTYHVQFEIT